MKGVFTGKIYASVEVEFDKVWGDLSEKEQHKIVADNIGLLTDDELISEIDTRGYTIQEK